jgi:broad specificity phosphatase PhoE
MLTVRFIRHGESVSNAGGFTTVYEEIPLTALGKQQAIDVSETVSTAPDMFFVSPYLRARQTSEPTLKKFSKVPVEIWPEVREFKYLGDNHIKRETNRAMRGPFVEAFWSQTNPDLRDGPGAETFNELMARVRLCLERLRKLAHQGTQNVVIFSHGQFMMALRMLLKDPSRPINSSFVRDFWMEKKTNLIPNGCGFLVTFDPKSGEDTARDFK